MGGEAVDLRQLIGLPLGTPIGGHPHRKPPYFRTKKLAIVGCTANMEFAPWHDPSWTLVSHCSARGLCKREPDWYFDMHRPECFEVDKRWNKHYYGWLRHLQTPIFMQEDVKAPWHKIPMAVRYPIERITAEFANSITGRLYATNHAAYMIALAMTEGITHIGLFGCQYASNSEYGVQRDSLSYWMGRFEQYGGKLVVPPKWNTLLDQPHGLYGYESHDDQGLLVEEYRHRKPAAISVTDPGTGQPTVRPLADAGAVPLMALPDGEAPDFERAKRLFGEVTHDVAADIEAVV